MIIWKIVIWDNILLPPIMISPFYLGCNAFWSEKWTPTYQKVVSKTFRDYLNNFMKLFLDDFTFYNDMDTHL